MHWFNVIFIANCVAACFGLTRSQCVYKGVKYSQGQRWDDGCDLRCECINEKVGYYTCYQRCNSSLEIPAGCTLETDPNDYCCQVPVCRHPG